MANIKIAFFNESSVLTDAEVQAAIKPLQTQITRDFAPVWGVDAELSFVPKGTQLPAKSWQIGVFDDSDQAGALGYHDLTKDGLPLGKVFARTDIDYKSAWTVTASHELLEMLGDPDINLYGLFQDGWVITFYAYEVCDACEADKFGYKINGALVSDFVYPAWFEGFRKKGSTQFDYGNHIQEPFQLIEGGYISIYDASYNNGWIQQYPPAAKIGYDSRPRVGSRRERRSLPRKQWMKSKPRRISARATRQP
jgi:hypothetical protein